MVVQIYAYNSSVSGKSTETFYQENEQVRHKIYTIPKSHHAEHVNANRVIITHRKHFLLLMRPVNNNDLCLYKNVC